MNHSSTLKQSFDLAQRTIQKLSLSSIDATDVSERLEITCRQHLPHALLPRSTPQSFTGDTTALVSLAWTFDNSYVLYEIQLLFTRCKSEVLTVWSFDDRILMFLNLKKCILSFLVVSTKTTFKGIHVKDPIIIISFLCTTKSTGPREIFALTTWHRTTMRKMYE